MLDDKSRKNIKYMENDVNKIYYVSAKNNIDVLLNIMRC